MARQERIAIIGLGTVGTAIGVGLKRAKLSNIEVAGHDRDADTSGHAKKRGAVDSTHWNLPATVEGAGLVILALPYDEIIPTVQAIAPVLAPGAVVSDTAIVKRELLEQVPGHLPEGVHYIGGNPILRWQETSPGVREATTQEATYCLLPALSAPHQAVETMTGLVSAIGARPLFVDPAEHDAFMAATVQVPELFSAALLSTLSSSASWREMQRVTGDLLLRFSEALVSPSIHASELQMNETAVNRWLDAIASELSSLGELARTDSAAFNRRIEALGNLHLRLSRHESVDRLEALEAIPNIREEMGRAIFGQRLLDAARGRLRSRDQQ